MQAEIGVVLLGTQQGCGSALIFCGSGSSSFLNAEQDLDPGGKMNADPCGSGSTDLGLR